MPDAKSSQDSRTCSGTRPFAILAPLRGVQGAETRLDVYGIDRLSPGRLDTVGVVVDDDLVDQVDHSCNASAALEAEPFGIF